MGRSTVIIHNQIKQFTSTDLLLLLTSLSLSFESWMTRQTQHAPCLKEKTNEISTDCLPMHLLLPGVFCVCYFFGFQKER